MPFFVALVLKKVKIENNLILYYFRNTKERKHDQYQMGCNFEVKKELTPTGKVAS